ncbi:hypothetical protein SARC_14724, partial [Sphaeroforma arctica JP610]
PHEYEMENFDLAAYIIVLEDLVSQMYLAVIQNKVYDTLLSYGVDLHIVQQMFMQLSYFISAQCLNNLLLRKYLCNWYKGLQIQYNVSQIEAWLRDHKLDEAKSKLACIYQATRLLGGMHRTQLQANTEDSVHVHAR